jgi:hypothetical protein
MPKFCGPFAITAQINDVTYRLDLSAPMISHGIHNAFHAKLLRPYHSDTGFERTPGPLCPCNSLTATLNMRLTKSFVSASIAGNRSIWFIGKAMATTKIHGCRPLTSTALTSLPISIEPRTARPKWGDDDRFHLSFPRIRHV